MLSFCFSSLSLFSVPHVLSVYSVSSVSQSSVSSIFYKNVSLLFSIYVILGVSSVRISFLVCLFCFVSDMFLFYFP